MNAPDLLTRCRAVLARMHTCPVIPLTSVDADVLAELERRHLVIVGRQLTYSSTGSPFCAAPSTFTLDPEPGPEPRDEAKVWRDWFTAACAGWEDVEDVEADLGRTDGTEPKQDAGWPLGADRGVQP